MPVKSKVKISQNFVDFSEYTNFNLYCHVEFLFSVQMINKRKLSENYQPLHMPVLHILTVFVILTSETRNQMEINVQETVLKFSYNPKYMALSGRAPLIQKTRLILVVDLKSNIFEELSSRKSKPNLKSKIFDATSSMNKLSMTNNCLECIQ